MEDKQIGNNEVEVESGAAEAEADVIKYNQLAMEYLGSNQLDKAKHVLRKAISLLSSGSLIILDQRKFGELMCITMNNQACLYKHQGKPNVSLSFLTKALLEAERCGYDDGIEYANTLLNVCAILSGLSKHHNALTYVTKAVNILDNMSQMVSKKISPAKPAANSIAPSTEEYTEQFEKGTDRDKEKPVAKVDKGSLYATLGIAYYNMGAELEFLQMQDTAVEAYRKGVEMARKELPNNHPVCLCLEKSLSSSEARYKTRREYHCRRFKVRSLHKPDKEGKHNGGFLNASD
jgi:tetratricopeptide (TPR) repeat protein